MSAAAEDILIDENRDKYLLFSLGDDLFATPLLTIREVIEPQSIKELPNTVDNFQGVINLRGEIVGVLDLRLRFKREAVQHSTNAFVVFETEIGPISGIVDKIESVINLPPAEIEENPNVSTSVPREYLLGVGKFKESLITLIDLAKVLSVEEIKSIRKLTR